MPHEFTIYVEENKIPNTMIPPNMNPNDIPNVHIVHRHEWGGVEPTYVIPIEDPVMTIRYHFTDTKQCHDYYECSKLVREIQKKHMDQGLPDIQYNFLIGGDGNVYEGTGWKNRVIDISHHLLEEDGGSRYIVAYLSHRDDIGDDTIPLEKLGYDLINWGMQHKLIVGGAPYDRRDRRVGNPYAGRR